MIPNVDAHLFAEQWLQDYVDKFADKSPNSPEQWLSMTSFAELYKEYKEHAEDIQVDYIKTYDQFTELRKALFPDLHCRQYVGLVGKCHTCFLIDNLRKTGTKCTIKREGSKKLHHMHRGGMFMQERRKYKERVAYALANKETVLSLIIDGMDQAHSRCPYMGRMKQFNNPLKQHLTGVLAHGHGECKSFCEALYIGRLVILLFVGLTLYRNVDHVGKGADLTIYCILNEVEKWRKNHNGKYPEELLIQIDGGSENANKNLVAMLELLVAKKVSRKIVLTRLPVGHTHEDIDACFAHIWLLVRGLPIATLEEYKELLQTAKSKPEITDIYVIPDYDKLLSGCIDPQFGKWAKEEYTQLQWKFEAVPPSLHFPLGVRVMYRAYSSDQVIEIVEKPQGSCLSALGQSLGLEPVLVNVHWYPNEKTFPARKGVVGFYLLHSMPYVTETFEPAKFDEEKSSKAFESMINEVRTTYGSSHPEVVMVWNHWWENLCPKDKTAVEYVKTHQDQFRTPLLYLFKALVDEHGNITHTINRPGWMKKIYLPENNNAEFDMSTVELECSSSASVKCYWNTQPPDPRTSVKGQGELREREQLFRSKTTDYYAVMQSWTKQILTNIAAKRVNSSGARQLQKTGSAGEFAARIKVNDVEHVQTYLRIISSTQTCMLDSLFQPATNVPELNSIVATLYREDGSIISSLTRRNFRCLAPGVPIVPELANFAVEVFNYKERELMKSIESHQGEQASIKCDLFKGTEFLDALVDGNNPFDASFDVRRVRKVFAMINVHCWNSQIKEWVIVEIDLQASKFSFLIPYLDSVNEASREMFAQIYHRWISVFTSHYPNEPPREWSASCQLPGANFPFQPTETDFNSGIFCLMYMLFRSSDLPIAFTDSLLNHFRQVLALMLMLIPNHSIPVDRVNDPPPEQVPLQ